MAWGRPLGRCLAPHLRQPRDTWPSPRPPPVTILSRTFPRVAYCSAVIPMNRRGRRSFISLLPCRLLRPERKRPLGRGSPQRAASSVAKSESASLPPGTPAGKPHSFVQDTIPQMRTVSRRFSFSQRGAAQTIQTGGRRAGPAGGDYEVNQVAPARMPTAAAQYGLGTSGAPSARGPRGVGRGRRS